MPIEEHEPWRHATQNKARLARGVNNDMKKVGIVPVVAMMTVAPQVFDVAVGVSVVSGMLARTYENELIEDARSRAECPAGMRRVEVPIRFCPAWVWVICGWSALALFCLAAASGSKIDAIFAVIAVAAVFAVLPFLVVRRIYLAIFGVTKYSYEGESIYPCAYPRDEVNATRGLTEGTRAVLGPP